ncbi:3-oxo-tetronate kinase [Pseudonocardia sp. TRM90224]|uniref:3-oxo-tetronate kinase n=1 Tax=Pseudonocardia sp. TRM90224 TaxID=2812678 RepID=UPI001E35F7D8|nr:3-oxo-tetronate kinase [Pseudonocardia sp. TRM90224]
MIGAIADDVTGATDVAVAMRREGLRTLLVFGVPSKPAPAGHDAVVVALKSRTIPAADAVEQSCRALGWLQEHGAESTYFKFCSTFDSTPAGNIGPVLDALADEMAAPTVVLTPSSPEHARTQYLGHLFVGDVLISDSHMRHHPLTPMTDPVLARVLQRQTERPVGLIPHAVVRAGRTEIRAAAAAAREHYLLVDAVSDADLREIGAAVAEFPLVAGASGLAAGLAAARRVTGVGAADDPVGAAPAAVLAGSCSARTLEQVEAMRAAGRPTHLLDVVAEPDAGRLAARALDWFDGLGGLGGPAPLVYSSVPPARLAAIQAALGAQRAADLIEQAMGEIAAGLVARGVRRIVAAGGETSGAVVAALGVEAVEIGPEAARGVPWIYPTSGDPLALLLKSGNFGEADLLVRAT